MQIRKENIKQRLLKESDEKRMNIREMIEAQEERLSDFAAKSKKACRERGEEPCLYRTAFQQDRDRILHSKAFRRLKHKTQVYISPGDHYRTRMTHSLEVSQICRTITRALNLNEDLTEAIALGHDVGHTPFGHAGEQAIARITGHFEHNEQSLRILDHLEKEGQGLNLTAEVRDGILNHTGDEAPKTLEGAIVKTGDRMAYLCHDFDDGMRAGVIGVADLPYEVRAILGERHSDMITAMVTDMIASSTGIGTIRQSDKIREAMDLFRNFMFERVYLTSEIMVEREKAAHVISGLYERLMKNPHYLPTEYLNWQEKWGLEKVVVDYIAGLTDLYAITLYEKWYVPSVGLELKG